MVTTNKARLLNASETDADAKAEPDWGPERFARRYQRRTRINPGGAAVYAAWAVCCVVYMGLRVVKTLQGLGTYLPYGAFVLFVELLGASATAIYGARLIGIYPELPICFSIWGQSSA